jgi:hypothetical protein
MKYLTATIASGDLKKTKTKNLLIEPSLSR